jgi:hypothetical protein
MTAFFIPGLTDLGRVAEDAYVAMRAAVELDVGRRPSQRRILQLWSRRGGLDCLTEVGRPDPVHGDIVMAIFDLGRQQPFVVQRQPAVGVPDGILEVLDCRAYSVLEFDSEPAAGP